MGQVLLCVGHCLSPGLQAGEVIEVEPEPPLPGHLAVYCGPSHFVCHRVLYRRKAEDQWWYFFKPDNTRTADGWIPEYRLLGRVTRPARPAGVAALLRARAHHLWWACYLFLARLKESWA